MIAGSYLVVAVIACVLIYLTLGVVSAGVVAARTTLDDEFMSVIVVLFWPVIAAGLVLGRFVRGVQSHVEQRDQRRAELPKARQVKR